MLTTSTAVQRRPKLALALLLGAALPSRAAAQSPAGTTAAGLLAPGISQALARHRAATVAEVRYDLSLDVSALDSAAGHVTIRFRRTGSGDAVIDFRGRRVSAASANGRAVSAAPRNGHLVVPARLLRAGENVLELAFVADIAPTGASIIRTHDADRRRRVPLHAARPRRRQPALSLLRPARPQGARPAHAHGPRGLDASSRTAPAESADTTATRADAPGSRDRADQHLPDRVRRRPVGDGELDRERPHHHDVRPQVARGGGGARHAARAQRPRRSRGWSGYFGAAYPFEKLDFVLAPAFPFGGMEHPGAIFYNEDRFIFRERPTLPRRLGRTATI